MADLFTPGLRNQIMLDGNVLPVMQGSQFSMPENMTLPQVFSGNNLFQYQYVPGLQYPTITLHTQVMAGWFTAANLNKWFITRISDDVASAGALQYWDGASGISIPNAKVNSISLGGSQGDMVRCTLVLIGYGTPSALVEKPSSDTIDTNPAKFADIAVTGGLSSTPGDAKALSSFDIAISNNLDVCPDLNGTEYPTDVNSGQLTGTLRVVQQAKATALATGGNVTFTITPPGGSPVALAIANVVCLATRERSVQFPRQMRERNYVLLGNGGPDTCFVTIS